MEEVETITKYRTSDGKEFYNLATAQDHAEDIGRAAKANETLRNGGSVADALRIMGRTEIDPILERVTMQTALVIEHWQCRDTPGYMVTGVLPDGQFRVYGDAGSWSGPYGGDVPLSDLIRYAKDKRTVYNPLSPRGSR